MNTYEESIIEALPNGSVFIGFKESKEKDKSIVEFSIDNTLYESIVDKIKLNTYFSLPIVISFKDKELTLEEVYEIINEKYKLGLVKDKDYIIEDNNTLSEGNISLPISENSIGYTGYIPVLIVKTNKNIIPDGDNRDLRGVDINYFFKEKKIQSKLAYKLFSTIEGNLFSGNILTTTFRTLISDYLKDFEEEYVNDIINSHIEKFFSDGLSDIIALRTPKGYLYFIRFRSYKDDLPR